MLIDMRDLGTVWECWIHVGIIERLCNCGALTMQNEIIRVRVITKLTPIFTSPVDLIFSQCFRAVRPAPRTAALTSLGGMVLDGGAAAPPFPSTPT